MRIFKKSTIPAVLLIFFCILTLVTPIGVSATNHDNGQGGVTPAANPNSFTITNPLKSPTLYCLARDIIDVATQLGMAVIVIMIMYAGFLFVLAQGNPEKLSHARSAFMWSVIGAGVLLGAWMFAMAIAGTIQKIKDPASGFSFPTCATPKP